MTRKLVSNKELKSIYGVPYSFAHIARLEGAGDFPKRIKLGACRVAWIAEEVEFWIEERIANRAQTSPFLKGEGSGSTQTPFTFAELSCSRILLFG